MKNIIYADSVFFINFCMDFLSLFLAGKIMREKLKASRLIISSAFGSLYALATFFFGKIIIPEIVLSVGVSLIMCLIAYNITTRLRFVKIFALFYSACFMLGGGIQALYYLSGLVNSRDNSNSLNSPPIQIIIILAGICAIIFIFTGNIFKRESDIKQTEIIIAYGGKNISLSAILDSGNFVRDPISALPVIIINMAAAKSLFNPQTLEFFMSDAPNYVASADKDINREIVLRALKFKLIPVKSLGGSAILPAFLPEYIKYKRGNKLIEINAVVAVDNDCNKNNNKNYAENCSAIVPSELIC